MTLTASLAWLGATDVVRMEGIVAEGAREMARRGTWAVPYVHGAPYLYKPPLAYWIARASFAVLGENAWSLRVGFALCAALLGGAVFAVLARSLTPRVAAWSAVATTTGFLFLQKMRIAEFDAPLAAGVGVAVVAAAANLTTEAPRAWRWWLAAAGLTAGALTKGPIAFALYAPGLVLAALVLGRARRLLTPAHLASLLAAAAACGLWLWRAWVAAGETVFAQPRAEASLRALDWDWTALARTPAKPLVALALFAPWGLALPLALGRRTRAALAPEERAWLAAALAFAAGGLAALMVVPTYEPRYFLPLAAPLGIASGIAAARHVPRSARAPRATTVCLAVATLAWLVHARLLEPRQAARRSLRTVAETLAPHLPPGAEVWTPGKDEHSSLFFYLDHPLRAAGPDLLAAPPGAWVLTWERTDGPPTTTDAPRLLPQARTEARGTAFLLWRVR